MADINSNLPVIDLADGTDGATAPSVATAIAGVDGSGNLQALSVDTSGRLSALVYDFAGNGITSASNGLAANRMLHVQMPDTTTASTALGALNANVSISVAGLNSVGFQLAAGTLIGTIQAQSSIDGGTTWTNVPFYNPSTSTIVSSVVFSIANTVQVLSILPVGGSSNVRVIVSAYTSGTANGLLRASNIAAASGSITSAAFNTVTNTYPVTVANTVVLLLAANANRKYAMISTPTTAINIQLGSSTGLTNNTGVSISTGGIFELKGDNLYTGAIYGIAGSIKTISVVEGTP